ncbi:MAG: hypothetical protein ABS43_21670 [Bordetella sp. SCN 67-23]|nr:DUF1328 domain-containing protein [Burkholderiales bacterium]ODS71041.1 MAG: hypothetical protein ABS43_21670 [Bordetella sp. SCN 67-23]ODU92816.1 MAG: hypothetical protein ABT00_05275 [Bordetella sp. SCN 68-11]OJW94500.1 MAG: hypothetical protein BGO71_01190 [Burkholderiales bacterium 67-32]
MLRWATIFFVIPLLAAVAGFSDFAASAANIAVVLFLVSLGAFLATFFIRTPEDVEEEYQGEWSR